MRKCCGCGETKNLKSIVCQGESFCNKEVEHSGSLCKSCYFEMGGCEEEGHYNHECINDESCLNHQKTVMLYKNWENFDYYYKEKKK